eukprot:CAMPEP_0177288854 /NCGR_PEP_ID=MMETSP0367-20130122/74890_1 /TAXON_ID=447022 ORGANISM="Scrippsiella hangoei-like, Strain SHHI-4" /NCGR_SAMPLE_ID=MMETSP0367 /ASSEMBLY_ACC=CAM_ASM_000362 /LENGTH=342 /DNA_ID=CAMNT_0018746219 /DNA_START=32 /DNA_END=1060 /DNA_ORIENTATION=+
MITKTDYPPTGILACASRLGVRRSLNVVIFAPCCSKANHYARTYSGLSVHLYCKILAGIHNHGVCCFTGVAFVVTLYLQQGEFKKSSPGLHGERLCTLFVPQPLWTGGEDKGSEPRIVVTQNEGTIFKLDLGVHSGHRGVIQPQLCAPLPAYFQHGVGDASRREDTALAMRSFPVVPVAFRHCQNDEWWGHQRQVREQQHRFGVWLGGVLESCWELCPANLAARRLEGQGQCTRLLHTVLDGIANSQPLPEAAQVDALDISSAQARCEDERPLLALLTIHLRGAVIRRRARTAQANAACRARVHPKSLRADGNRLGVGVRGKSGHLWWPVETDLTNSQREAA